MHEKVQIRVGMLADDRNLAGICHLNISRPGDLSKCINLDPAARQCISITYAGWANQKRRRGTIKEKEKKRRDQRYDLLYVLPSVCLKISTSTVESIDE